jgi:hypothetical protein
MPRLVHVGFSPAAAPKLKELEPFFASLGDWIRYSPTGWLVWTNYTPQQISDYLKPQLNPNDHMLVLFVDPVGHQGWMPPWVWNWIATKMPYSQLGLINTTNPFYPQS